MQLQTTPRKIAAKSLRSLQHCVLSSDGLTAPGAAIQQLVAEPTTAPTPTPPLHSPVWSRMGCNAAVWALRTRRPPPSGLLAPAESSRRWSQLLLDERQSEAEAATGCAAAFYLKMFCVNRLCYTFSLARRNHYFESICGGCQEQGKYTRKQNSVHKRVLHLAGLLISLATQPRSPESRANSYQRAGTVVQEPDTVVQALLAVLTCNKVRMEELAPTCAPQHLFQNPFHGSVSNTCVFLLLTDVCCRHSKGFERS